MKFKFTCDICFKRVSRGDRFDLSIFKSFNSCRSDSHLNYDNVCIRCIKKVDSTIKGIRKQAGITEIVFKENQ